MHLQGSEEEKFRTYIEHTMKRIKVTTKMLPSEKNRKKFENIYFAFYISLYNRMIMSDQPGYLLNANLTRSTTAACPRCPWRCYPTGHRVWRGSA